MTAVLASRVRNMGSKSVMLRACCCSQAQHRQDFSDYSEGLNDPRRNGHGPRASPLSSRWLCVNFTPRMQHIPIT